MTKEQRLPALLVHPRPRGAGIWQVPDHWLALIQLQPWAFSFLNTDDGNQIVIELGGGTTRAGSLPLLSILSKPIKNGK